MDCMNELTLFVPGAFFVGGHLIVSIFVWTGTFKLVIEFSEEYPNKPPTVRFLSKMFHPNGE